MVKVYLPSAFSDFGVLFSTNNTLHSRIWLWKLLNLFIERVNSFMMIFLRLPDCVVLIFGVNSGMFLN